MTNVSAVAPRTPFSGSSGITLPTTIARVAPITSATDSTRVGQRRRSQFSPVSRARAETAVHTTRPAGTCGAVFVKAASAVSRPRPKTIAAITREVNVWAPRAASIAVRG